MSAAPDLRAVLTQRGGRTEVMVQSWGQLLAVAIALLCPIVAVYIGGDVLGASDPLMLGVAAVLILGRRRGKAEACYWMLAVFLLVAFTSLVQIDSSRVQVRSAMKWIRLVGICLPFYLGLRLRVDVQLLRRVGWALFWGGTVALLAGLVIYQLQIPIRTEGQRLYYRGGSFYRAGGLIGETTAFGHLIATWSTLSFGLLIWAQRVRQWKWVLAVIVGLGGCMVFMASSRAGMLNMLVFALMLWSIGKFQRRTLKNVLMAGALLASMLVILQIGVMTTRRTQVTGASEKVVRQVERFIPVNSANEMSSGRLEAWQKYARIIRNHLWLGCGYKTATRLMPGHTPDNSVLSALLETGILGLIAIASFGLLTTFSLWNRAAQGNAYAQVLGSVWCGQLVQALTNDTHTLLLGVPVLYLITGLVLQLDAPAVSPPPSRESMQQDTTNGVRYA